MIKVAIVNRYEFRRLPGTVKTRELIATIGIDHTSQFCDRFGFSANLQRFHADLRGSENEIHIMRSRG